VKEVDFKKQHIKNLDMPAVGSPMAKCGHCCVIYDGTAISFVCSAFIYIRFDKYKSWKLFNEMDKCEK
jgi:uncharacterized membrane protein